MIAHLDHALDDGGPGSGEQGNNSLDRPYLLPPEDETDVPELFSTLKVALPGKFHVNTAVTEPQYLAHDRTPTGIRRAKSS